MLTELDTFTAKTRAVDQLTKRRTRPVHQRKRAAQKKLSGLISHDRPITSSVDGHAAPHAPQPPTFTESASKHGLTEPKPESAAWDRYVAFAQIVASFATIIALVAAAASAFAAFQAVDSTREQTDTTRRGQLTDRFTAAVDQLGSDRQEVRLGGIYALEQVAKEDPSYQPVVIGILSAFVRLHGIPSTSAAPAGNVAQDHADAYAAFTVIARRNPDIANKDIVDLSHASLVGVNLSKVNHNAYLQSALMSGVDLSDANLDRAYMAGATLDHAVLSRVRMIGNLSSINLEGSILVDASLPGARIQDGDLRGANLTRAKLNGAYLAHASMIDAILIGADLGGADLRAAFLDGADFTNAQMAKADLRGTDLRLVLNLDIDQLNESRVDETTTLPPAFSWSGTKVEQK
ncbi:pentapeptide repeat-containing protein [Dactylosporangium sp. NPDC051541]|uniref:pentapeptide repeat-containing protein n=1 Tax=Dactylosporangium sp. NPDC051541 TaxID=3363977 RepID=UPI003787EC55